MFDLEGLPSRLHPREWHDQAACDGADTRLFFPPRVKGLYDEMAAKARAYCFGEDKRHPCPVRKICLEYAIVADEEHGLLGGMSHRERNALVRKAERLGITIREAVERTAP